jgi:hypothetical protein
MKSVISGNTRLEYESALGDDFMLMDDWVHSNLSEAEMLVYTSEGFSSEKQALMQRWTADQKITSLKIYIDDVLQPL